MEGDKVVLKKAVDSIDDLFGILGRPPRRLTLDQMEESIARAVVEKYKSR
jgi:hypothetical protein